MSKCKHCGIGIDSGLDPMVCDDCIIYAIEHMKQDAEFSADKTRTEHFSFRAGTKIKVFNTTAMLEEMGDFLHLDIEYRGNKIEISLTKAEGDNDLFKVWLGDKQFILCPNGGNHITSDGLHDGAGRIIREVPYKTVIIDEEADPIE